MSSHLHLHCTWQRGCWGNVRTRMTLRILRLWPSFAKTKEAEAEELQQVGDCLSETGDSQQAFHDEPCLSELVRTLSSSSLSSEDTTAYGWSMTTSSYSCSSSLDSVVDTTAYGSSVARTSCSIRFSGKNRAGIAHNAMGSSSELDRDSKTNPNEQYKLERPSSLCNSQTLQYSRYMVYRDSDTSAQPFQTPSPSDDSELSMGPVSTDRGRVSQEQI